MSEKQENKQISRRQFLRNAGIVVGGTAVGSTFILSACGNGDEVTKTVTVTTATPKFVSPFDGQEFDSLSALEAYITENYLDQDIVTVNKYISPYDGAEFDSLDALKAHLDENYMTPSGEPGVVSFVVNGKPVTVKVKDNWDLAYVLRDRLGLFATKIGCNFGQCGTCTVLIDGVPVFACVTLAVECSGKNIETADGLTNGTTLSPLQQKFYDLEGFQCGFCTPGFIMAGKALLAENPNPSLDEVREAVAGHLCACGNTHRTVSTIAGGV